MGFKKNTRPVQLNKFMHPRNPYKCVSFKQLAISYPEFRAHCTYDVSGKVYLDFKNTEALKALTTVLLNRDYGLKVSIPDNRLVPTLPLRMNYLLWIEDLLSLVHGKSSSSKEAVVGFDIGTGAVCVYPLIGTKMSGWHFIATETDDVSFESAKENIDRNNLQNDILLKKSSNLLDVLKEDDVRAFAKRVKMKGGTSDGGVAGEAGESESLDSASEQNGCKGDSSYIVDFTVCNPPFFSSEVEMDSNHNSKKTTRSQPVSAPTGSAHERVTDGGEVAFVGKIVESSLQHKEHIRIFSTLVGVKSHVKPIVRLIQEKAKNAFVCVSETEFCQGRTMRWGVAWTFDPSVPLQKVISKKQQLSQKPMVLHIPRSQMSAYTVQTIWTKLKAWLKEIKIKPHLVKSNKYFVGATIRAYKATWLHQRQKKRKKLSAAAAMSQKSEGDLDNPKKRSPEDEQEDTENPSKKSRVDLGEIPAEEMIEAPQDASSPSPVKEGEPSAVNLSEHEKTADEVPGPSRPECLLKAWMTLKHTESLISIEVKYLSGTGKKEAINQLLQYFRNKIQYG